MYPTEFPRALRIILLIITAFSLPAAAQDLTEGRSYTNTGDPLPPVRLITPSDTDGLPGKVFTDRELRPGIPVIVMLFNPTCGDCITQGRDLFEGLDQLPDREIILMAGPMMQPYLESFIRKTGVGEAGTRIRTGVDSSGFIRHAFLYQGLPQLNLYDGQHRLLKTFTGLVTRDSILHYQP